MSNLPIYQEGDRIVESFRSATPMLQHSLVDVAYSIITAVNDICRDMGLAIDFDVTKPDVRLEYVIRGTMVVRNGKRHIGPVSVL